MQAILYYKDMLGNIALATLLLFSGAGDPNAALKEINEFRSAQLAEARASGKAINAVELNKALKEKATTAIDGVKPNSIKAADGYAWMQLFMMAERYEDLKPLCDEFMKSMPAEADMFNAENLCMRGFYNLGKYEDGAMTASMMKPQNVAQVGTILSYSNVFAPEIASKQGIDKAVKFLDGIIAKIPATLTEADEKALPGVLASYYSGKSELYTDAGKKDEAMKVLDTGLADSRIPDANKRSLKMTKTRMGLVGAPAPEINSERGYGEYPGLEGLKGKVVVIDFFAHWCPPCKAAFPDMRKMYDDLKPKGLEIIGVTRYYGYYNAEKNLNKDDEFARMADFNKEFNINWPLVYDANDSFTSYGVSGIPTSILVDRDGIIRSVHVGYSAESYAKFRKEVEELLKDSK
jgi:peroxiredoxin